MSQSPKVAIRIMGVLFGIVAGTIAAFLFRGPLRSIKVPNNSVENRGVISVEVESEDDEVPSTPPDPGRRKTLKGLVEGAKAEKDWLKEFELTERSGKIVKSEDLRGEPYIACFFFSTCPGSCPRLSSRMELLQNKFKGKPIKFVSISVDPEIDTPEVLSAYAEKYHADKDRWFFLTGPLDYVVRVGTEKFFLGGVEKRGHPDRFCLVNAEGDVVGSYVTFEQEEFQLLLSHVNELLK